jgi:hypothetical protein
MNLLVRIEYYSHTLKLRFWAYFYFLYYNFFPSSQDKKKKSHVNDFENYCIDFDYQLNEKNSYFYTYSFFTKYQDLTPFLIKNKEGYFTSYIGNSPSSFLPLIPGYYGLVLYNHYKQYGEERYKTEIGQYAAYIISKMEDNGALSYNENYNLFNQKAPWQSGITQAIVACFLIRAHLLFPKENYLAFSQKAIDFMLNDKRLNIRTLEGLPWIEEYPSQTPTMVLNGFMFSVISIIELGSILESKFYKDISKIYLDSLVQNLHKFLFQEGIRHNLKQLKFGNVNYEALHVFLFYHLYKITHNYFFYKIALHYFKITNWKLFYSFYNLHYDKVKQSKLKEHFSTF